MRLVYVVPFFPYPAHAGATVRIWNKLKVLAIRNQIDLVVQSRPRAEELLAKLQPLVNSVSLVPAEPFGAKHRPSRWAQRWLTASDAFSYPPAFLRRYRSQALIQRVRSLLLEPTDWLLCDTQLSGQLALAADLPSVPRALCLYDLYDLDFRRKAALTPVGPYKAKVALDRLKLAHYERRIMRRFDLISCVSPEELEVVERGAADVCSMAVPNGVDLDYFQPSKKKRETNAEPNLLFVGGFEYEPNVDAIRFFLGDIWPRITHAKPESQFIIVGAHPPIWLREAAAQDRRIVLQGEADDLRPLYSQADVVVAPLRLGAGTRLKVLEAMASGVPVVTTALGSSGIYAAPGRDLLLADEAEEFAAQVLTILADPGLARELTVAGRSLVEDKYSWSTIITRYEDVLRDKARASTSSSGASPRRKMA